MTVLMYYCSIFGAFFKSTYHHFTVDQPAEKPDLRHKSGDHQWSSKGLRAAKAWVSPYAPFMEYSPPVKP